MDELARKLEAAREQLSPQWNPERSARLYAGTLQRKRRRTVRRAAVVSAGVACTVGLFAIGLQQPAPKPLARVTVPAQGTAVAAAERSGHTLRLADGSFAELVGSRSELEVMHNSASRVGLKLLSGRAHFEVVHDPMRSFVVEAAPYRVEVIGTVFDVERNAKGLTVGVARGRVRVYGPHGAYDVVAGQTQGFDMPARPSAAAAAPAIERVDDEREPAGRARARSGRRAGSGELPGWRSLSQSGQYEAAFASLSRGESVEDDAAALMDAADAARLSGHPQSAVQYLGRVVRGHRKSPVSPLAAFTLGRVYLDELGQPDGAAEAFELARKLAPNGSLAQDALAREVEALSKGGNARKAYVRAREYLERYPNGRRVRAVQLYGGL